MDGTNFIKNCEEQMSKRIQAFDKELTKVRTGRASTTLLDGVKVDYYGTPSPLSQVASLSTPDARTILVSPFEKKLLSEIERAIHMAAIGIQPNNDGTVIRLPIPPLNEERRKELAKQIKKLGEDAKIIIRELRQDFNHDLINLEKNKVITEDSNKKISKDVQILTDKYVAMIDEKVLKKEKEVLSM